MKEIWKNVKGYEGLYEVSNLGRVKSLAREDSIGRKIKERILKTPPDGSGYAQCNLCLEGKTRNFFIHKLVAMAFLDHKPDGMKIVVDHIDNNKSNNRLENLQLISQRQNSSKDKKGGSSEHIGVTWDKAKSKWMSRITIDGRLKYLGYFTNEIEASEAYQLALNKI